MHLIEQSSAEQGPALQRLCDDQAQEANHRDPEG
jgi:hypothetical protein